MSPETTITGLARLLVSENLLEREVALAAFTTADKNGTPLVRHLVKNRLIDSKVVAKTASQEFGLPLLDISAMDPLVFPLTQVDSKLLSKHNMLPILRKGHKMFLAVSDPSNQTGIDEIKFNAGCSIDLIVVEDDKLNQLIESLINSAQDEANKFDDLSSMGLDDLDVELVDESADVDEDVGNDEDETPIVRFVNKILVDLMKMGGSDIHIEPYEKIYRIRFRVDGVLKEITRPPLNTAMRICSRIKIMSNMDIAEKRVPQDGRIKMKISRNKSIDFRVNTLPTLWGEKIVMRLLDASSAQLGIDMLGYEPSQKQLYLNALHQHQGLILVTGPTGSGKTVSLYTGLNILNTHEKNISTAEDPVEINLEGINQVAVNAKVGLTFATALRAFLRQDPDVVMVGEIRDLETAEIAIKASQTGHMVMSTLHTNSAPETLTRLRNMGIPSYNLATSISLIIAQRLARRLCSHCKKPLKLPPRILMQEGFTEAQLQNMQIFGAVGCDRCNDGYKGRVGIYEVVPITDKIARCIMDDGSSIQIADIARAEGYNNLRTSALMKVAQGLTSLAEANRLT
ncbi:MAG: type IV-A pilus assembly ATPase PilB [Pseudomonadota bacterium]